MSQPSSAPLRAGRVIPHVRKGEKGSLVVYANTITRTETGPETGEEGEQSIPFMKEQAGAYFGVHMNADYVSARAFRKAPSVGLGHGVTVFQERLELLQ